MSSLKGPSGHYLSLSLSLSLPHTAVGARYISISAYQASRDDEISFVSGAIVKLIKKYADGWWLVRYACSHWIHYA